MSAAEAPEGVDPGTGEIDPTGDDPAPKAVVLLNEAEARKLTAEIKAWCGTLWVKVRQAYEGQAWRALGYSSWSAYVNGELPIEKSQAYRLIAHAQAVRELDAAVGWTDEETSPAGDTFTERDTRRMDIEEAIALLEREAASLPADADVKTRSQFMKAVTERMRATAKATDQTTKSSPPAGKPASRDGESGGEAPSQDLPAAESPEAGVETGDGDGADESDGATRPADESDASDGGVSSSGTPVADSPAGTTAGAAEKGPDASPPVASGPTKAQVSGAFAAALVLLTADAAEAAEMLVGDERDDRAQDCERLADWLLAHHDAVMDRGLRAVQS